MWIVCKTLHKLPNDPLFRTLAPLQIRWIIDNIVQDHKEQAQAIKFGGKEVSTSVAENDDFDRMVEQRRRRWQKTPQK